MKNAEPLVSVVVLSYDRPDYLPRALASVAAQTYPRLEVIVVDNPSPRSGEIARLVAGYPNFRLLRNAVNRGFTGGMNRGIEAASGDYVHLTLDDVALDPECIARLVEHAERYGPGDMLSGILYAEDRRTINCAGSEFSLSRVYRRAVHGEGEPDVGQFSEPFGVSCIQGSMVFGPAALLKGLGGFREDFFMYLDSIELSARVLKSGRRIVIVPAAKAYVYDAPHAFTEEWMAFHKIKNLFAFYLLHARAVVLPEFFLRYGVIQPLRALRSNRKVFAQSLRAWGWLLTNAPGLLKERRRWARRSA